MDEIANFYHSNPIIWTLYALMLGYFAGRDNTIKRWREWHENAVARGRLRDD